MPHFRYKAFDSRGLVLEGAVDAPSDASVIELVRARGITPFEIIEGHRSAEKWWRRELFLSRRPKRAAVASFTRDLAILLQARVALGEALRIVSEQTSDRMIRELARNLGEEVIKGHSFSEALAVNGTSFGDDYLSIVRAGEMSGALGDVFGELCSLQERRIALDAKIKSALVYPAVLAVMASISVGVIAAVLVPNIAPIFTENGKALPPFIGAVVAVENNLSLAIGMAVAAAGMLLAAWAAITRIPYVRLRYHTLLLRLPVLGKLILQRETARLVRTFGTLLRSGVPIMPSFTSAAAGVSNLRMGAALSGSIEYVREGKPLAEALAHQNVLPALAVHMVAVGEQSGQLDQLLLRAAALFEELSTRRVDRIMSLLTPALTVVIAGLVGALIMSIMSAILSINDLAAQ